MDPNYRKVKQLVRPILERMIWICMNVRNVEKSAAETDISVVTLPSQKLKAWKKMRLEETILQVAESPEGGRTSYKYGISGVSSGVNVSVTVRKIFVRWENTEIKMNGAIAGDSETGRRKFTEGQWAALIGFCGVESGSKNLEEDRKGL